ncbi:hypothetical protein, partial [Mycobacterium tuberculosis]
MTDACQAEYAIAAMSTVEMDQAAPES